MAKRYLKRYGHRLLDLGYEVVGIKPGTKFPTYDYSHETLPKITPKHIDRLLSNGHARDGVGIRSRFVPMVDIDSKWEPLIEETVREAEHKIGPAVKRIGEAPKVGLIYRTSKPFGKVQSKAFTDPDGNKAQLEVQGDGQQWVAFAIHPKTKAPYNYPDQSILEVRADHLTEITEEQARDLCRCFEKRCIDKGWPRWKKDKTTALTTRNDPDDIGGNDSTPLGLSIAEVRAWVDRLPNDESV
jgi:hypothetical protein